jgi:hypothetical protein
LIEPLPHVAHGDAKIIGRPPCQYEMKHLSRAI